MNSKALYPQTMIALVVGSLLTFPSPARAAEGAVPAKQLFGYHSTAAPLAAAAIGSYARGCLAGGQPIATEGPGWQAMRLSRNRNWGHPDLVAYLKTFARDVRAAGEWNGLLIGDLSQPRGGPMLSGHASHQIGLDADIWLNEMPERIYTKKERETVSAVSVVNFQTKEVDRKVWTERHATLIKRATSYPSVARIFVNPIIKKELCRTAGSDRRYLRKVRPWAGHHYHMHIRLKCPKGAASCKDQAAPPAGDGCGEDLARWFRPPPPGRKTKKRALRPPLTLARLPVMCARVVREATVTLPVFPPSNPPRPRVRP
ncbi:MAG: penicillin-insensitive murein endopeptidase [Pseudomonadota bacterium]